MWDFLKQNIAWIFSGAGVTLFTVLISYLTKRKKRKEDRKIKSEASYTVSGSQLSNSTQNNFVADSINYQQHIYNNPDIKNVINDETTPIITSEDLINTKDDFLKSKKILRTFLYRVLAPARNTKNKIEVRDVTDAAEEKLMIATKVIVKELQEMEQEGIIKFIYINEPEIVTPYTRIQLTSKFYSTIKAKS